MGSGALGPGLKIPSPAPTPLKILGPQGPRPGPGLVWGRGWGQAPGPRPNEGRGPKGVGPRPLERPRLSSRVKYSRLGRMNHSEEFSSFQIMHNSIRSSTKMIVKTTGFYWVKNTNEQSKYLYVLLYITYGKLNFIFLIFVT